jgi:hypothetical protein
VENFFKNPKWKDVIVAKYRLWCFLFAFAWSCISSVWSCKYLQVSCTEGQPDAS